MKAIHLFYILIVIACISVLSSCEYEFIEIGSSAPPPPDTTASIISFATEIAPIFTIENCTQCHTGSFYSYEPADAYQTLIDNNLAVPYDVAGSKIWYYPFPVTGQHQHKYSTVAEADSIAKWINQGALNN